MKIIIDSVLRLQDVPADKLKQIKMDLTLKNPEYAKKRSMKLPHWAWGPEYIKLYSERDVNGTKEYILPRGYFARLWNILHLSWEQIDDQRVKLPEIAFPANPQLRDYQAPAVGLAKDWQQGVFIAPCGSGKTESGLGMIAKAGQPTLWIAHTLDLINQSMERARLRLGLSGDQIGIVQGEKMSIGSHITFATVQTLAKRDLTEIKNMFGCVVIDEAHLCFKDMGRTVWDKELKQNIDKGRMFESVIAQIPAFYRFGLTASEYRSDGLISTMFNVIGPKFYEVLQDDPRLTVLKPRVEFIETSFMFEMPIHEEHNKETDEMEEKQDNLSVQQMYVAMREDLDRQRIVYGVLNKVQMGDYCLVLGDSLDHLECMHKYVRLKGYNSAFIHGGVKKPEREKIMAEMRAGKYQFLMATYALAKLGLDIPRLNRLLLVTPKKDRTSVQQAIGRIMRPFEGKQQPVVYDIWDSKVKQCNFWARERAKVYRDLGAEVIGGPKVRRK